MELMLCAGVSALIFGLCGAMLGNRRGQGGTGMVLGALLGPFGLGAVLFLDDRTRRQCPHCSEQIKRSATKCAHCHEAVEPIGWYRCQDCEGWVVDHAFRCKHCGVGLQKAG